MYKTVIWYFYTLQNDHCDNSGYHLLLYKVITLLDSTHAVHFILMTHFFL